MLSSKYSRMLANKKLIALYNKDLKMVKKIESIKYDYEVTEEIINYHIKEKKKVAIN